MPTAAPAARPIPSSSAFVPGIASQPASQTNTAGSTVLLSVAASGTQPLSYQWQFNSTNLTDNARITGSQSNTLTIANVSAGDAGSYQAIVNKRLWLNQQRRRDADGDSSVPDASAMTMQPPMMPPVQLDQQHELRFWVPALGDHPVWPGPPGRLDRDGGNIATANNSAWGSMPRGHRPIWRSPTAGSATPCR